jgi:hypothetical protein
MFAMRLIGLTKRNTKSRIWSTFIELRKMKRNPLGRPPLPKGHVKNVFTIRLNEHERQMIEQAAKRAGLRMAEWGRSKMLEATALSNSR